MELKSKRFGLEPCTILRTCSLQPLRNIGFSERSYASEFWKNTLRWADHCPNQRIREIGELGV